MEITVKFDELYAGDDGRVSEVVINAIAAQLVGSFTPEVREQIKLRLSSLVDGQVEELLATEFAKVLNGEFDKVDSYGSRAGKTTLRQVVAGELKDAVSKLTRSADRGQGTSPLKRMIEGVVTEMVGAEVKAHLAEIRKQTTAAFVGQVQAAVEKVR